jgi:hypothetical protein
LLGAKAEFLLSAKIQSINSDRDSVNYGEN